jgi:predicted Ser/Thr protein kinase
MTGPTSDRRADGAEPTSRMAAAATDTELLSTVIPPGQEQPETRSGAGADAIPAPPRPTVPPPPSVLADGTDTPLRLPCSFGDYELLEEIARGGMGVVYKARQKGLDRLVALKMILTGPQATPSQLERFAREARAAAALDHPNIVPVYDNGWHGGHPFFTMALVDGVSLQRRMQTDGPPEPREAVHLLRAVAGALAYAHGQGVVHRDLKPHNVLIDRQGRPRVADFGLARRTQEVQGLTHAGDVLGTPNYMAPEQALGQVALLGPGVDVYGLGGLLYFLLTGQPPFTGETAVSVLCDVLDKPPRPPREIRSDVPPELEAICLKCLEKHPARRYPSAAALDEALAAWEAQPGRAEGPVPPAPPPAHRWRRGVLLGAAGALVVGGALLVLWPWVAGRQKPPVPPTPPVVLPELPRDLRHDFGLRVELLGGREDPDGLRVFRDDEPVRYHIQTERNAYVGIWTVGPDGTVVQLFPNEYESEHLVPANQPRLVPGNDRYTLDATASPAGKAELLRVVAATRRWEPLKGEKPGAFVVLPDGGEKLEQHLRSIKIRPKPAPGRAAEEDAVAEVALPYQVLPR